VDLLALAQGVKERGEGALVPFFTAGYPDDETFLSLVGAAAGIPCHAIEIGVPFSDPMADGPVIQESSAEALRRGVTVARCFELARAIGETVDRPLVFMTYVNPVLQMGAERFADECARAGVSGVIIPDLPVEESGRIRPVFKERRIVYIGMVAPTSTEERIARIVGGSEGFIYLVSIAGVTGSRFPQGDELAGLVGRVRKHTDRPLYAGFGVSNADLARSVARHADGVIIGSAIVRIIRETRGRDAVRRVQSFLLEMKHAIATVES
jgi:tryptophan synthase alpha chain